MSSTADAPARESSDAVVVIPALEPDAGFAGIVAGIVGHVDAVVVVDDGSGPGYAPVFEAVAAQLGVTVLTHPVNRGKGAALRTAFEHCLAAHPGQPVVTADSDGQHTVTDILRVAAELSVVRPDARGRVCVLGARQFTGGTIPWKSRLGNRLTQGVVRLLSGRSLPDTQTGLRAFSAPLLPALLAIGGDRFEYEMSALMWMLRHDVPVHELPIETRYEDGRNEGTHFRPLRDSALVYGGLLREFGGFALVSGACAVLDLGVFALVAHGVFDGSPALPAVATATVTARVVSGLVNYAANRWGVFSGAEQGSTGTSLGRYVALAVGLLAASSLLTSGLGHLLGGYVVWAKVLVDGALFGVSYLAQRRWVYRR